MIQIKQFMKDDGGEKDMNELAVTLNLLDTHGIEYDLEPPVKFKGWKKIGNKQILIEDT